MAPGWIKIIVLLIFMDKKFRFSAAEMKENRQTAEKFVVDTDFNSECDINKSFWFHHRQTSEHIDRAAAHKLKYMNTTGTNRSQN